MPTETVVRDGGAVTLQVFVDGPTNGPPLVLLPSSLRGAEDFAPLVPGLVATGWLVLRPQPRGMGGMGGSRGPMAGLTLDDLAADVHAVIQQLGGGRAVVAGHAFGHYVARVLDLRFPQAVRGLVLLAAAARSFPPGLAEALAVASDPSQPEPARLAALQHAFFAPGNPPRVWLPGWHPELRTDMHPAAAQPAKSVWWPVAQAPILELQGDADPWRPPATRAELQDALGADRVQTRLIAGASHALLPEQPAAVVAAISDWAATLPP
ncbi:MAG: alpha/beta hydrolase [Burkholderiaceae bacterium]|nr:alpha/beta hydrolase [Burkholderiaceae bacterium]